MFFTAILHFLPVVLEFPLDRKTNKRLPTTEMKKEAKGEKWIFTNSTVMTKYQGSLTALSKLKIMVNDTVVAL